MIGKGGGGDNGIRTVECLRGRLLAERVASKAAKEEADLMAKRLDELEKQVAEEIKSRNRAEKRLKYALKKLRSLKLLNPSESSAGSSESWKTESGTADSPGRCGSGGEMKEIRRVMKDEGDDGLGSSSSDSANQMVSQEGSWSSVGTAHSWSKEVPVQDEDSTGRDCEDSITDCVSQASHNADERNNAAQQAKANVHSNDTLALVPVKSTLLGSTTYHSDASNANVQNVLLALRHVKERLRNSMER